MKKIITLLCLTIFGVAIQAAPSTPDAAPLYLNWIDHTIAPDNDFFHYANGTWIKNNPIPLDRASWSAFDILQDQNDRVVKSILETAAAKKNVKDSIDQKIGDFYASGMDEKTINQLGASPLKEELSKIAAIKNSTDLQNSIAHLQMIGVDAAFGFGQIQDLKNSQRVIAELAQGGVGLPDQDYYLKDDPQMKQVRAAYRQYMQHVFVLLGDSTEVARQETDSVMTIETALSKASMRPAEMRDPHAIYHMMTLKQLKDVTPHFNWPLFFKNMGRADIVEANLATPGFFTYFDTALQTVSLEDWKIYLRWRLVSAFVPYLSDSFVNERLHFSQKLSGIKTLLPRWHRVLDTEEGALGFAIGKRYVEKMFPSSSKVKVEVMINEIRAALRNDLKTLSWMTPATRVAAIKKLDAMRQRVGYPTKWRDYSALHINRDHYLQNVMNSNIYLTQYELNKIGKPVDHDEWTMLPQEVNAYYDPSENTINMPAGILQSPFFDIHAPAAINDGAVGVVIGHEMTHGFDDEGAQFDGGGNLKDWWTAADLKKFKKATLCISNQFSQYTIEDGTHVQGPLVTGEAVADLGGVTLAHRALLASNDKGKTIADVTFEQQFFLGFAHVWASHMRPEMMRLLVTTNPHPPAQFRVNGTLANVPAFQAAYHLPKDSPMANKDPCVIW